MGRVDSIRLALADREHSLLIAEKTVVQADVITLSYEDQLRFAQALIDQPPLTPAMERAIDRYERMAAPA